MVKYLLLLFSFSCTVVCNVAIYPLLPPEAFPKSQQKTIQEGYERLLRSDFVSARQFFQNCLNSNAEEPALYYLAQSFLQIGQIDRAHEYLSRLKDKGSLYQEAYRHGMTAHSIALGNYFLQKQDWDSAFLTFKQTIAQTSYRKFQAYVSELYIQKSRSLRQERRSEWCAPILKQAVELNPEHEECLEELCNTLLNENNFNELEPYLKKLVGLFPNKSRQFRLALVYTYTNRIPDSFEILTNLHRQYPNDAEITEKYQQIQSFLNFSEKVGHEVENYQRSHNKEGNEQLLFQARKLVLEQKWTEAEALLEQGYALYPSNWFIISELSALYRLRNKANKSLELLQQVQSKFDKRFEYQLEKGLCLEKNHPEQAIKELLLLVASPAYSVEQKNQLRKILGRLYLKTGRLDSARNMFNLLLEQEVGNRDEILFYFGMYYTQSQYFQKSIEYYEQAHKLKPDNPRYLLALATSFRQLGHNEEAQKYLRMLMNAHPESRFTDYALKIFQDFRLDEQAPVADTKTDELVLYQIYMAFQGKSSLDDKKIIELLEQTHQWDRLITFLEQKITHQPKQSELSIKLEQIYSSYEQLDFNYRVPNELLLNRVRKLQAENKDQEVVDFYAFMSDRHIILTIAALSEIAKSAIKIKDYTKAIDVYQKMLNLGAEKTDCYSKIGYAYFMQNKLTESLDTYYKALSYNPANPQLLFKLAELLKTIGEKEKARLIYEEIVQLNINTQSVKDARFFLSQLKNDG